MPYIFVVVVVGVVCANACWGSYRSKETITKNRFPLCSLFYCTRVTTERNLHTTCNGNLSIRCLRKLNWSTTFLALLFIVRMWKNNFLLFSSCLTFFVACSTNVRDNALYLCCSMKVISIHHAATCIILVLLGIFMSVLISASSPPPPPISSFLFQSSLARILFRLVEITKKNSTTQQQQKI